MAQINIKLMDKRLLVLPMVPLFFAQALTHRVEARDEQPHPIEERFPIDRALGRATIVAVTSAISAWYPFVKAL